MLASQNRLRKKNDIDNIFRKGKTIASGLFFLKFIKNDFKVNRFAFVVSRKISNKAVERNKVKRRLREAVKQFAISQGFDFIIIARPVIVKANFQEIKDSINEIFNSKINKIISKQCF